jgi:hypothetical protein
MKNLNLAANLETCKYFAGFFLIFIFVIKNYCLYVFIGAPKFFLARAPKYLNTALSLPVLLIFMSLFPLSLIDLTQPGISNASKQHV